jgi:hypothetical protein
MMNGEVRPPHSMPFVKLELLTKNISKLKLHSIKIPAGNTEHFLDGPAKSIRPFYQSFEAQLSLVGRHLGVGPNEPLLTVSYGFIISPTGERTLIYTKQVQPSPTQTASIKSAKWYNQGY